MDQLLLAQRKRDAAGQGAAELEARQQMPDQLGALTARCLCRRSNLREFLPAQCETQADGSARNSYSVKPRMPERFSPDSARGWRCRSSLFQVQLGQYKTGRPLEQLVLAAAQGRGCRSSPDHLHNFAARGQCCWSSADQLLPALRKTEAA